MTAFMSNHLIKAVTSQTDKNLWSKIFDVAVLRWRLHRAAYLAPKASQPVMKQCR